MRKIAIAGKQVSDWQPTRDSRGRPRTFVRGHKPGDERRINTGNPTWDGYLFVADNLNAASSYGDNFTQLSAKPEARILYEGTQDFVRTVGKWRKGENGLQYASRAAKQADEAGYDAIWFRMQGNIGTAIINPHAFESRELGPANAQYSPG